MPGALKSITTPALEIGYLEAGEETAPPVILVHGFPDDARTWDRVVPILNDAGFRTLCPFVRGYGPTRFLDPATPRSAQYTALASDITAFADALELERFTLVGHDWGARASYCVAAMRPRRLNALIVSPAGYGTGRPAQRMSVDQVRAYWYQWFFCTGRGRDALEADAAGFCRELWRTWSPGWDFPDAEYEATARSFDNPDFVEVVMHSYRYRWGYEKPDPRYEDAESFMAGLPDISVPTVLIQGAEDGASRPESSEGKERHFTGGYRRILVEGAGHFAQREKPEIFAAAILEAITTRTDG